MVLSRSFAVAVLSLAGPMLSGAGSPEVAGAFQREPVADDARGPIVSPARDRVRRIQAHFDSVLVELVDKDLAPFTPEQRARRSALIATLAGYRDRGEFPNNYDFADPTPYFVDRKTGIRCAVAFLLESTGRHDIVDRVARTNNNVRVAQLAGDSAMRSWLDAHALTLAEAARIQVPYAMSSVDVVKVAAISAGTMLGFAGSSVSGVWNATGNRDGHHPSVSIIGVASGVILTAASIGFAATPDLNPTARTAFLATGVMGVGSVWLASRAIGKRHALIAARDLERARERVEFSVAPLLPIGRHAGSGLTASIRF